MEIITELLDDDIRQTYIIMFEKNDMRYIFNRSVRWNSILKTKNIEKLVKLLGKDAINHFIILLNDTENTLCDKVNELTNRFVIDDKVFKILEVHPEWENINREDQNDIEDRKDELCKQYNAVKRKDQLDNSYEIDKYLATNIKKQFKQWLIKIYKAIIEYAHVINDEIVQTALGTTIKSLKNEKAALEIHCEQLHKEVNKLRAEIDNNKKKLSKQNYVIDAYNRYLNSIDDDELEKLKKKIIYDSSSI